VVLARSSPRRCPGCLRCDGVAILHQCRHAGLSFTAIEAMQFETPVVINALMTSTARA
jgi:hypothetical protein